MKITENETELVLRDVPLTQWFIGAFCLFIFGSVFVWIGLYAYFYPQEFFTLSQDGLLDTALSFLMYAFVVIFLMLMIGLFVSMILTPVVTLRIRRSIQTIEIRRRGLLKNRTQKFPFAQVNNFGTEKISGDSGYTLYLVMILVNEAQIKLGVKEATNADTEQKVVRLNDFLQRVR